MVYRSDNPEGEAGHGKGLLVDACGHASVRSVAESLDKNQEAVVWCDTCGAYVTVRKEDTDA